MNKELTHKEVDRYPPLYTYENEYNRNYPSKDEDLKTVYQTHIEKYGYKPDYQYQKEWNKKTGYYKKRYQTNKEYYKNYYQENKERHLEQIKKWTKDNRVYWNQYLKEYRRSDKGIELRNKIRKNNSDMYQWNENRFIEQLETNGDYCSNTIQHSSYLNDPVDLDHYSIEPMECY